MKVTDELLMALADDELDADLAASLQKAILADPALAARYAIYAETAQRLRSDIDLGPTPERLITAIAEARPMSALQAPESGARIIAFPARRPRFSRALQWGSIAAALLIAFLAGQSYPPQAPTDGNLAAYATLATGQSLPLDAETEVRAIASYQTEQGLCRSFDKAQDGWVAHEILCRDTGGTWQVALRLEQPTTGDYLPASDALSRSIDSYLDAIGAGAALDAQEESLALRGE